MVGGPFHGQWTVLPEDHEAMVPFPVLPDPNPNKIASIEVPYVLKMVRGFGMSHRILLCDTQHTSEDAP